MKKQRGTALADKRIVLFIMVAALFAAFAGCGKAPNETAGPEPGEEPAPDVRTTVPADLLSDELNVFSDTAFPQGYTVYAAGFVNNVDFYMYELYLTAEGDPEEIITYISNLVGDSAPESIQQNINYYTEGPGLGIDGKLGESEAAVNCKVTPTEEGEYDYNYVEGCNLRLRVNVSDPAPYQQIIEDNFNLASLSDVANYFEVTPITGKSRIYVRKNHNNAQIDVTYGPVEDVAGIMERMKDELTYKGFDEGSNFLSLVDYGEVSNSFAFNTQDGSIGVYQSLDDAGKCYQNYSLPTTSLTKLGFVNYIVPDALCEYRDEANDLSIAVNIPQWGSRPDEWENSSVMFFKGINKYGLAIWYYPDEGKYVVQADRDGTSVKYSYLTQTGEFTVEHPNADTVKAQLEAMYDDMAEGDIYMQSIELFQAYVSETFGMSVDELYAAAAIE